MISGFGKLRLASWSYRQPSCRLLTPQLRYEMLSTVYRIVDRIVLRRKSVVLGSKRLAVKTGSSLIVAVKYVSGQYGHREEQSRLVTTSK